MIINRSLTKNSYNKLTSLKLTANSIPINKLLEQSNKLNSTLNNLLNKMINAIENEIILIYSTQIDITYLKTLFRNFNRDANKINHSKFENDLLEMNKSITLSMCEITVHFLYDKLPINLIATIMHALWIFYQVYPIDYSGLTIYVCLDNNVRDLMDTINIMKQKSVAFNVSGMTQKSSNVIYLTRQEEIIKLMFHELAHYVGFDELFNYNVGNFNYCIKNNNLKLYEAYSEFLSIIFNSAYQAIRLAAIYQLNVYQLYSQLLLLETHYSLVLTARILKFYGYNANYKNFFYNCDDKKKSPISIWEYVFLRASLMYHMDDVCRLATDFRITITNRDAIIELMQLDDYLINELGNYFDNDFNNVSYTLIDVVWD